MNKTIKEQLDKMENRLDEALDNDLFNDSEFDMDEFQSEVCSAQWKFSGDKHKSLQVDTERTFHLRYPLVML